MRQSGSPAALVEVGEESITKETDAIAAPLFIKEANESRRDCPICSSLLFGLLLLTVLQDFGLLKDENENPSTNAANNNKNVPTPTASIREVNFVIVI